jgi:hypothetical protein
MMMMSPAFTTRLTTPGPAIMPLHGRSIQFLRHGRRRALTCFH